jgi:hypothetical protein
VRKDGERFKYYKYLLYSMKKIIVKVRENKKNKQKTVTIPKDSKIKCGDYVEIIKI